MNNMQAFSPVDLRPERNPLRPTTLRVQLPEVAVPLGGKVMALWEVALGKPESKKWL
jgi:hypothetical protein